MRVIDQATVSVEALYNEPAVNVDGSPLADLAYTSVYYKANGGSTVEGVKIPASKPAGGGGVQVTLLVPAPVNTRTMLDFWVTGTDTHGNVGPESTHVAFEVERISPAAPTGFSIA